MRIALLGYQRWGLETLRALARDGRHEGVLVVTHPPSAHPYERIWNEETVEEEARRLGLPVRVAWRLGPELVRELEALAPDVIISSNWRTIVPPDALRAARVGAFNLHEALLPRFAGFAPLNWAVAEGATETGVTAHHMVPELDAGDVIRVWRFPIGPSETATDMFERTLPCFSDGVLEVLDLLEADPRCGVPQETGELALFHKRDVQDGAIDWSWPRERILNLVRAQSDPYPNAYTTLDGRVVRVKRAELSDQPFSGTPGRIVRGVDGGLIVVCGREPGREASNEALVLSEVEPADPSAVNGDLRPGAGFDLRPLMAAR